MNAAQVVYLSQVPAGHWDVVADAFEGAASPRQAIRAKCLDCKNHRRQPIMECDSSTCALHFYRPYQPCKGRVSRPLPLGAQE